MWIWPWEIIVGLKDIACWPWQEESHVGSESGLTINSSPAGQNGRYFAEDIFKCIFLNKNSWISNKISLQYVPKGPIDNNEALVQIMAWHQTGNMPLSEPMIA